MQIIRKRRNQNLSLKGVILKNLLYVEKPRFETEHVNSSNLTGKSNKSEKTGKICTNLGKTAKKQIRRQLRLHRLKNFHSFSLVLKFRIIKRLPKSRRSFLLFRVGLSRLNKS